MVDIFLHALKNNGWKQIDIAEKTGLSQQYVCDLFKGKNCSIETAIRLADTFGVTVDIVLGRSNQPRTVSPTESKILETVKNDPSLAKEVLQSAQDKKLIKELKGGRRGKEQAA